MTRQLIMLWGIAVVLLTLQAVSAETNMVLDLPLERQVIQRNAQEWAEVKVAGAVPADATLVEARAELGAGLRGQAIYWTVVAQGAQIKDGKFNGSIKLATGGWYTLKVRFRKSAAEPTVLGESSVGQVGVGDVYITAGQSNSVNYGHPRQKSAETLSVYFDGKQFTPAADPILDACGDGGTPWPILGDMLSRTTRAPVCFRSATINWVRVREWVPGHGSGNIERVGGTGEMVRPRRDSCCAVGAGRSRYGPHGFYPGRRV